MSRSDGGVEKLLGSLVLTGLVILMAGVSSAAEPEQDGSVPIADGAGAPAREVVLYYFHGTRRCQTCLSIESYATQAIEAEFGTQLADGTLVWKVVDFDKKTNRHFVEDFNLVSSSLVLVEASDDDAGRFEVLQDAWTLVRNKKQFMEYVQNSVRDFLY
jgi:hypothetical protein